MDPYLGLMASLNSLFKITCGGSKERDLLPDLFIGGVDQSSYSQGKLETFTGAYEHCPLGRKKEIDAIWAPTPQGVMNSGGRSIMDEQRDAWLQTMPQSRNRANEAPAGMAPEMVGRPGARGGTTGDVYYDMREYAYEPNVDALRPTSRPKLSFEGRALPGNAIDRTQFRVDCKLKQACRI